MQGEPPPSERAAAEEGVDVPKAHVVLWGAIAGALIGVAVLYADFPSWDADDRVRASQGPFLLWMGTIAAQTMAWVFVFPVFRRLGRRLHTDAAARSREIRVATGTLALLGAAIAFVPPLVADLPETVPHRGLKVAFLNIVAFGLAIYGARAIWFAGARLRTLADEEANALAAIQRHRRYRADLEILLAALGTLVTLAVVASAALRALTVSVDARTALPAQSVILYGVVLSLILALVYTPAYLALLRAGRALRDRLAPLVAPDDPTFGDRVTQRERLDALLGLNVAATVSFRAGVAILSPLLGSLTSLLPELGG